MITLTKEEFEKNKNIRYKRLEYLKTDKNGSEYYQAICPCDRCNGHAIVYTHVCNGKPVPATPDQGICWKCLGTGEMKTTIKVFTPEYAEIFATKKAAESRKKQEQFAKNVEKTRQLNYEHNIELGYKEIDFTVAAWVGVPIHKFQYYRIAHQTDKAILLSLAIDLYMSDAQAVSIWIPIKAITFNKR